MGDATEAAAARSEQRDRSHDGDVPGPGRQPGRDARAPVAGPDRAVPDRASPDTVTVLLRRLRDAAAAHDGELVTWPGAVWPGAVCPGSGPRRTDRKLSQLSAYRPPASGTYSTRVTEYLM